MLTAGSHSGRRRLWRRRLLLGALAVIVVWIGVGLGIRVAYSGEILPGTRVAGIGLGGASPDDARRALASAFSPNRTVTLRYRDRRFSVRARDVGYHIDLGATVARAHRAGREGALRGLWSAVPSLWAAREVEPVLRVDRPRLDAVVASIARKIDRPQFPGALAVDGGGSGVRAVAPRPGRELDRDEAAAVVLAALRGRAREIVPLPVRARPTVRRDRVDAVALQAQAYLDTPVRLSGGGETKTVGRREVARILALEKAAGSVRLGVDRERAGRLVDALAADVNRDPVDARVVASPRPFVVDDKGDLTWRRRPASVRVGPARSGRALDRSATVDALAGAVRHGRHTARLALKRVPAALSTEAARNITSVLGTFTTRFACCQPRVKNIQLIAKAVDGTVILPGQQFSLNRVAGPRTRTKGYLPAPFIADGKLVDSVGGGVSQFSTTMYNAAYFAGLRLDGHQAHSFYIDRYPPGREATLDYASIDLLWTNDTTVPVLVRATSDGTSVTVTLYGASRVRRVDARAGARVPASGGGFALTVTRTIRIRGRASVRQPYTTTYVGPPAE